MSLLTGLTGAETNHALQAAAYPAIPFPGVGRSSLHQTKKPVPPVFPPDSFRLIHISHLFFFLSCSFSKLLHCRAFISINIIMLSFYIKLKSYFIYDFETSCALCNKNMLKRKFFATKITFLQQCLCLCDV
jgi:hypothetical protein